MTTTTKAKPKTESGPRPSPIRKEVVEVPEWGVKIEVRAISINGKIAMAVAEDTDHYVSQMLFATCFDPETGERLFTAEDVWLDDEPSGSPVEDLLTKASEVSGLLEDEDAPKDDS